MNEISYANPLIILIIENDQLQQSQLYSLSPELAAWVLREVYKAGQRKLPPSLHTLGFRKRGDS